MRAKDLQPGDRLFRHALTVNRIEDGGINSAGESMFVCHCEESDGIVSRDVAWDRKVNM